MDVQKAIFDDIKRKQTIIIHRHQRPDPDAVGSQVGLAKILQQAFPKKKIFAVGKQIPGLAWLAEMDEVEDAQCWIPQTNLEWMISDGAAVRKLSK